MEMLSVIIIGKDARYRSITFLFMGEEDRQPKPPNSFHLDEIVSCVREIGTKAASP